MKLIRFKKGSVGDKPTNSHPINATRAEFQLGGLSDVSKQGYKANSPYRNNPYLNIFAPGGAITMKGVDKPLMGVDEYGVTQHMYPGNEYSFPGQLIKEIPMKKGGIHIKKSHEGAFNAYKKRTGKTTEEALHSHDPHVRQMANFARNAATWEHKRVGGVMEPFDCPNCMQQGGNPYLQSGGTPMQRYAMYNTLFGDEDNDDDDETPAPTTAPAKPVPKQVAKPAPKIEDPMYDEAMGIATSPFSRGATLFSKTMEKYTDGNAITAMATQYGYKGDPYGDRNSLMGIGNHNNQLGYNSVALSKQTAQKLGLKPGDKLRVNTPAGEKVVNYDDTIPSEYGQDRVDFYNPNGKLSFDGANITVKKFQQGGVYNNLSYKDIQYLKNNGYKFEFIN